MSDIHPYAAQTDVSPYVTQLVNKVIDEKFETDVVAWSGKGVIQNLLSQKLVPDGYVVIVAKLPAEALPEAVKVVDEIAQRSLRAEEAADRVVDAVLPPTSAVNLSPAQTAAVVRNAAALSKVQDEFGLLTSAQVGDLAESTAENRSATATRWRTAQRIFGIKRGGAWVYPGFQFVNGQPSPVIGEVIQAFGSAGDSGWALTLWFTAPNIYLRDSRPVDQISDNPQGVVEAATHVLDAGP
ncbi:MAG: hypothetical protein V9G19_15505 [Tetrasphaera sp.]